MDKEHYFKYTVIFIIVIYLFSYIDIKLNILLALFVLYYVISKHQNKIKEEEKDNEEKFKKYEKITKYDDILEYILSVEHFYKYNPSAYNEMLENIDNFFVTYEQIEELHDKAGFYYPLIEKYRLNSINAFHSIIYSIPHKLTEEFEMKIKEFNNLFEPYLTRIENINKKYIEQNGYNRKTYLIDKFTPYNKFNLDNYTIIQ